MNMSCDETYVWTTTALIVLIACLLGFPVLAYYSQVEYNENQMEVFASITNTTTNDQIVNQIRETCSKTSLLLFPTDCETRLLKTFTIPTK